MDWSVDDAALRDAFPQGFDAVLYAEFSELGQEYLDAFSEMAYDERGFGTVRVPCPFENAPTRRLGVAFKCDAGHQARCTRFHAEVFQVWGTQTVQSYGF